MRATGEPGAGLVVTASTWPPPLRPRVLAIIPGGSSRISNAVSLVGPPAWVTPMALCHTIAPEKSSGVASARSAMSWRSASEANRAVRTRTVRPLRSRWRQVRYTTPWRRSRTLSWSMISPLESVIALPATMSLRPVQSGAGTGWRKGGSPVPSP